MSSRPDRKALSPSLRSPVTTRLTSSRTQKVSRRDSSELLSLLMSSSQGLATCIEQRSHIQQWNESDEEAIRLHQAAAEQISAFETEIVSLNETVALLRSEGRDLEKRLNLQAEAANTANQEARQSAAALAEAEDKLAAMREELTAAQRENAILTEKSTAQDTLLTSTKAQLTRVSARADELSSARAKLQSSVTQLTAEKARLEGQLEGLEGEAEAHRRTAAQLTDKSEALGAAQKQVSALQAEVKRLGEELQATETQARSTRERLEGELKSSRAAATATKQLAHQLEGQVKLAKQQAKSDAAQAAAEHKRLEDALETAKSALEEAQKAKTASEERAAQLKSAHDELKLQLDTAEMGKKTMSQRASWLQEQSQSMQTAHQSQMERVRSQCEDLQARLLESQKANGALSEAKAASSRELTTTRQAMETQKADHDKLANTLRSDLDNARSQLREERAALVAAQREAASKEEQLNDVISGLRTQVSSWERAFRQLADSTDDTAAELGFLVDERARDQRSGDKNPAGSVGATGAPESVRKQVVARVQKLVGYTRSALSEDSERLSNLHSQYQALAAKVGAENQRLSSLNQELAVQVSDVTGGDKAGPASDGAGRGAGPGGATEELKEVDDSQCMRTVQMSMRSFGLPSLNSELWRVGGEAKDDETEETEWLEEDNLRSFVSVYTDGSSFGVKPNRNSDGGEAGTRNTTYATLCGQTGSAAGPSPEYPDAVSLHGWVELTPDFDATRGKGVSGARSVQLSVFALSQHSNIPLKIATAEVGTRQLVTRGAENARSSSSDRGYLDASLQFTEAAQASLRRANREVKQAYVRIYPTIATVPSSEVELVRYAGLVGRLRSRLAESAAQVTRLEQSEAALQDRLDRSTAEHRDVMSERDALRQSTKQLQESKAQLSERLAATEQRAQRAEGQYARSVASLTKRLEDLHLYMQRMAEKNSGDLTKLKEELQRKDRELQAQRAEAFGNREKLTVALNDIQTMEAAHQEKEREWERQLQALKEALESCQKKCEEQRAALELRDQEILAHREARADLTSQVTIGEAKIKDLEEVINGLREQLAAAQQEVLDQRKQLAERDDRIAGMREDLMRVTSAVKNAEAIAERLEKELEALRAQLVAKDALLDEWRQGTRQHDQALGQLKEQIAELKAQLAHRDQTIAQLEKQLALLKATITTKEAEVGELRDELQQREQKISALDKSVVSLTGKLDNLEKAEARLLRTIDELKAHLTEKNTECADLRAQIAALKDQVTGLKEQQATLTAELNDASNKLVELGRERDTLKNTISERDQSLRDMDATVADLRAEIARLREELKQLRDGAAGEKERLAAQVKDLQAQLTQRGEQVSSLEDSLRKMQATLDKSVATCGEWQGKYEEIRGELEQARAKLNAALRENAELRQARTNDRADWDQQAAELRAEVQSWRESYEAAMSKLRALEEALAAERSAVKRDFRAELRTLYQYLYVSNELRAASEMRELRKRCVKQARAEYHRMAPQLGCEFQAGQAHIGKDRKTLIKGTLITNVFPGRPAAMDGLRVNDVVTHINQDATPNMDHFKKAVRKYHPGEKAFFHVIREGKHTGVQVEFGAHGLSRAVVRKIRNMAIHGRVSGSDMEAMAANIDLQRYRGDSMTASRVLKVLKTCEAQEVDAVLDGEVQRGVQEGPEGEDAGQARQRVYATLIDQCKQEIQSCHATLRHNMERLEAPFESLDDIVTESTSDSCPAVVRDAFRRFKVNKLLSVRQLVAQVLQLYFHKMTVDTEDKKNGLQPTDMADFAYEHFLNAYGLPTLAEAHLVNLCGNVVDVLAPRAAPRVLKRDAHRDDPNINNVVFREVLAQFAELMHLYTATPATSNVQEVYMDALQEVQKRVAEALPRVHSSEGKDGLAKAQAHSLFQISGYSMCKSAAQKDVARVKAREADTVLIPWETAVSSFGTVFERHHQTRSALEEAVSYLERHCVLMSGDKRLTRSPSDMRKLLLQRGLLRAIASSGSHGDVQSLFRTFDEDSSGNVDYSEFRKGVASLGLFVPNSGMQALISVLDSDGDGTIDYTEFSNAFGGISAWVSLAHFQRAAMLGVGRGTSDSNMYFRSLFAKYDENHDEVLTLTEFTNLVSDVWRDKLSTVEEVKSEDDVEEIDGMVRPTERLILVMFRDALKAEYEMRRLTRVDENVDKLSAASFCKVAAKYKLGSVNAPAKSEPWLATLIRRLGETADEQKRITDRTGSESKSDVGTYSGPPAGLDSLGSSSQPSPTGRSAGRGPPSGRTGSGRRRSTRTGTTAPSSTTSTTTTTTSRLSAARRRTGARLYGNLE